MKKRLAIIFIPIILAVHFPVTSQNLLPRKWVSEFENGKQWARLFLNFYRSQTAESSPRKEAPKAEPDSIPQPLVFRPVVVAQALAPAIDEFRQMQIEHSIEKCELSIRKVDIVEEQTLKAAMRSDHKQALDSLKLLKDLPFPKNILYGRVKVIRIHLPARPA